MCPCRHKHWITSSFALSMYAALLSALDYSHLPLGQNRKKGYEQKNHVRKIKSLQNGDLCVFCVVMKPVIHVTGCCKQEGGISLETRPSSSSLSESEMTTGALESAVLYCWPTPLGPGH